MKGNKLYIWLPVLLLVFPSAWMLKNWELSYNISSKGIVYPSQEWVLSRTIDGILINSVKDNVNNLVREYNVSERQRGDHASFVIYPEIYQKQIINKGDTIGLLGSQFEKRRLLELKGELEVQRKLLSVYASGEKPEEITIAREQINLAQQEYETQKRITERSNSLHEKAYISDEEYELSLNEYLIKKQNLLIAESRLQALTSGAKKEQIDLVNANIKSLESQIKLTQELINSFHIISPIRGRLIRQQITTPQTDFEVIARVGDLSKIVVVAPVDVHNLKYLNIGQRVILSTANNRNPITGTISGYDNSVNNTINMLTGRQKVFVTIVAQPGEKLSDYYPNMMLEVSFQSEKINLVHYVSRLMNEIYNN